MQFSAYNSPQLKDQVTFVHLRMYFSLKSRDCGLKSSTIKTPLARYSLACHFKSILFPEKYEVCTLRLPAMVKMNYSMQFVHSDRRVNGIPLTVSQCEPCMVVVKLPSMHAHVYLFSWSLEMQVPPFSQGFDEQGPCEK